MKRTRLVAIAGAVIALAVAVGFLDPETAKQVWVAVQDIMPATE